MRTMVGGVDDEDDVCVCKHKIGMVRVALTGVKMLSDVTRRERGHIYLG